MICKIFKPAPFVSSYIKEYFLLHLVFDKNEASPVKTYPINPKEGITFQFKGNLIAETPEYNFTEKRAKVNIYGIPTARQNLIQAHEFMFVNVEFQPGALFHFLKTSMDELSYGSLDASLILGKEVEEINDQLANTENYNDIPAILDAYFTKKINQLKSNFQPIDRIGRIILESPSSFNLDKIASEACMSNRNFEKKFVQRLGITPKYYARICRFYQAYLLKEYTPKLDWLSVAIECGYTDYQHLVKDFKQFAGVKPNILIEQSSQNPESRQSINPNFRGV